RRVSLLSDPARQVVEAASVVGREVSLDMLSRMIDNLATIEVLDELVKAEFLEITPQGAVKFVHDKLREMTYASLEADARRALHRAAALSITELHGDDAGYAAERAHHLELGGARDRATGSYLAAARHAASRRAHDASRRLYEAHLELSTTVSQRVRARIELSQQLVIRGELDAAVEQARLAVEEAENGDDTDLVIEACLEHGVAAGTHGRLDAKEYILTRLEPRLATSDNAMFYARWLYELGWIKRRRAQHREAQRL